VKRHDFEPSADDRDVCALCGETADASIHEMDVDAPDDERPDCPPDFPPTMAALFDSAGIHQP
jgi:hypothetical protein